MRKPVLLGLLFLLTALLPAFAGEVYVPFASNNSINGTTYLTKVWVTNTGTAGRRFDVRFIEHQTDGTKPGTPSSFNLTGGGTILLTDIAPSNKTGMLEISGAPQLVVTARLEAFANGELKSSASVPVAAVGNVFAAGKSATVQGLERTQRGTLSDFGLLNLSRETAQCTVKAFRANGAQIAQTVILSLGPLSVRHVDGALSALGETFVSDARIDVSCDKQFFPYALVYKPGGPDSNFITASGTLDGDLVPGGGGGPGPAGTVVYELPGVFLQAKQGASFKTVALPLVEGVQYTKATIEFDLATGRFPQGLFSGITSLRRNDRTLFYGLIVRGDRQKTLLDLGVTDDIIQGDNGGPWAERTNFHVWFEYDTAARRLTFKLSRNGTVVQTMTGRTNHNDLSLNGRKVSVDFGMTGIADGAYFPPVGWTYSNLKAVFEPEE
jgi:hypothetical protein